MKKILLLGALLGVTPLITTSCEDDKIVVEETIPVENLEITPDNPEMIVGNTLEMKVAIFPENATSQTPIWGSRNESVASIDAKTGIVSALYPGEAQIYVTVGAKVANTMLTVKAAPIPVESIILSQTQIELEIGAEATLKATIQPEEASDKRITWTSDHEQIASVSEGRIVAKAEGQAIITAKAGEQQATCTVLVTRPSELTEMSIANLDQAVGGTIKVIAQGLKQGDQMRIESLAGKQFTEDVAITNITKDGGEVAFPKGASTQVSYRFSIIRAGSVKLTNIVRPNNDIVSIPYALALYLTAENDPTITNDGSIANIRRMGYINGSIFEFDVQTKKAKMWRGDAQATPLNIQNKIFDLKEVAGITTLESLKNTFDFSGVEIIQTSHSELEELDLSMFPKAIQLHAKDGNLKSLTFGDGSTQSLIDHVNVSHNKLSTLNLNNASSLTSIYAQHNQLSGKISITDQNMPRLNIINISDNQLTEVDFGGSATKFTGWDAAHTSATIEYDSPWASCSSLVYFIAENNKLSKIDIDNCMNLVTCRVKGNPIQEAKLSNSAKGGLGFLLVYKSPECFSIDFNEGASCYVDYYWWTVLSAQNSNDISQRRYNVDGEGDIQCTVWNDWGGSNPLVQAKNAGRIKLYEMGEFGYNNSENYVRLK